MFDVNDLLQLYAVSWTNEMKGWISVTLLYFCNTDHKLSFSLNHDLAKSLNEMYSQSKTVVRIFYIHAEM